MSRRGRRHPGPSPEAPEDEAQQTQDAGDGDDGSSSTESPEAPEDEAPEPPPRAQERKPARPGRVWCRALRTSTSDGMPRSEGEEFTLPLADARRREDRGEVEIL